MWGGNVRITNISGRKCHTTPITFGGGDVRDSVNIFINIKFPRGFCLLNPL